VGEIREEKIKKTHTQISMLKSGLKLKATLNAEWILSCSNHKHLKMNIISIIIGSISINISED